MDNKNTVIIGCNTLREELLKSIDETGCEYPVYWVESGLHRQPEILRNRLQETLDSFSNIDRALLGFGFCGNSLTGLVPPSYELIFPRVDDCISLFFGSREEREALPESGTSYFMTQGWLKHETNIWKEYQDTVEKYGEEMGKEIYDMMLKNYTSLTLVDTGCWEIEPIREETEMIAETLGLGHRIVPGNLKYFREFLTGPWDKERYVTIPPGKTVTLTDLKLA